VDLWKRAEVSLQRRLDALIADFTRDILTTIGRVNLAEIVPARTAKKLARALETDERKAPPRKRVVRAPAPPKPKKEAKKEQEKASVEPPAPKRRVVHAVPSAPPAPDARTLEKMLLGAMRGAAPMNREDVLDSAAIGADHLESARAILDGLVERGVIGTANLSGAPLLFIKPPATRRRAPKKAEGKPAEPAAAPVEAWKPTVIRRKKASAEETAPANDANAANT
jgi:hypothetical protein